MEALKRFQRTVINKITEFKDTLFNPHDIEEVVEVDNVVCTYEGEDIRANLYVTHGSLCMCVILDGVQMDRYTGLQYHEYNSYELWVGRKYTYISIADNSTSDVRCTEYHSGKVNENKHFALHMTGTVYVYSLGEESARAASMELIANRIAE